MQVSFFCQWSVSCYPVVQKGFGFCHEIYMDMTYFFEILTEHFDNYMQQDAHECLNYLLNTVADILTGLSS